MARVAFQGSVAGDNLQFGADYFNSFQEIFNVQAFRFYIHKVQFRNIADKIFSPAKKDDYYLIDINDPSTCTLNIELPAGYYDQLRFVLGVDSLLNVSGAQDGVLDPAKGMFWTWNSGYIMAKLEGTSPASNAINHKFEYHIGGFMGPYNVVKSITINLPYTLAAVSEGESIITVEADPSKWFSGLHDIRIAGYPACTMPGELAWKIAGNYYRMFSVQSVNTQP